MNTSNEGGIGGIKPPYMGYPQISNSGDPSVLTTDLVLREVLHLKELLQTELTSVKKGIEVSHDDFVRFPTEVQKAVGGLQLLLETKILYESKLNAQDIKHITERIDWSDKIRLEQKADSSMALNAALASAKELVTVTNDSAKQATQKQEAAFNKQIDQLVILAQTMGSNLGDKIADIKDLFIKSDSTSKGKTEGVKDFRDWVPWAIAIGLALWTFYKG